MSSVFFIMIVGSSFGFFAYRVSQAWKELHAAATGKDVLAEISFSTKVKTILFEGFAQAKLFKDPVPGIMHAMIFWGFLVVSLGTLETLLEGVIPHFRFSWIIGEGFLYKGFLVSQDIGNTVVAIAILFAICRRLFFPPERLQTLSQEAKNDAYIVLSFILTLVTSELMSMGSDPALSVFFLPVSHLFQILLSESAHPIAWWLHVFTLCGFVIYLPTSKHQHLIWIWPNLFYKQHRSSGWLRPMEFDEEAESFGVGHASEFTWKQLLESKACVECGRCTSVCPAHTTGKKLDPRHMIHHLKDGLAQAKENPKMPGGIVSQEELWACTTCGACVDACPLHIEHIPAIVDMRRYLTMTEGDVPAELQSTLENLEVHSNPWGMNNDDREKWAEGLNVPVMREKDEAPEYLFWVGCAGAFDDRYKNVTQSTAKIMQNAGLDFAILGKEERCNGDTARRAGNEYLASMQIAENVETFKRYKVQKVVTGCPHCFNTLRNEYPDFDCNLEVIHHSELIESLVNDGKITPKQSNDVSSVTWHDSCYLGRHNKVYDSPRKALSSTVPEVVEMPRNKSNGFCCGAGGARMWMEETEGERVNVNRAKEAIATGVSTVATGCPFCLTMLTDGVTAEEASDKVQVKDVAEIIAEALPDHQPS
ncbi:MAG: heterodisulfide reductase-related iron-sulfur binding cluster [Oligoflexales bacterium]